jgi:hypothetical protein
MVSVDRPSRDTVPLKVLKEADTKTTGFINEYEIEALANEIGAI